MSALARRLRHADDGFTLVEMLVAMMLSAILGGILLSMLLGAKRSTSSTTTSDDLNGEARAALNRISRDLRQAVPTYVTAADGSGTVMTPAIVSVQNPDGPGHVSGAPTSVTFRADFNGDGCIAGVATDPIVGAPAGTTTCNETVDPNDPEVVTYCWDGSATGAQHIYLIPGTVTTGCTPSSGASQEPLVSGKIADFTLAYRSTLYRYDGSYDGTHDGITTWYELDAAGSPVGNDNGTLDTIELDNISSVVLSITVASGGSQQTYQTQIDLRNVS